MVVIYYSVAVFCPIAAPLIVGAALIAIGTIIIFVVIVVVIVIIIVLFFNRHARHRRPLHVVGLDPPLTARQHIGIKWKVGVEEKSRVASFPRERSFASANSVKIATCETEGGSDAFIGFDEGVNVHEA